VSGEAITVAEVREAIRTVLKHQRYQIMDRTFTFADLGELRRMEADLMARANMTDGKAWNPVRFQGITS